MLVRIVRKRSLRLASLLPGVCESCDIPVLCWPNWILNGKHSDCLFADATVWLRQERQVSAYGLWTIGQAAGSRLVCCQALTSLQPCLRLCQHQPVSPSKGRGSCHRGSTTAVRQTRQPSASPLRPSYSFVAVSRYHSLLAATPATTAADAPSLASLQGLLHVYKQSLDHVSHPSAICWRGSR